jgi:hypothetical protein
MQAAQIIEMLKVSADDIDLDEVLADGKQLKAKIAQSYNRFVVGFMSFVKHDVVVDTILKVLLTDFNVTKYFHAIA